MAGLPDGGPHSPSATARVREVRRVPDAVRSEANARSTLWSLAVAIRRRAPAGRSDAPAHALRGRPLREDAAPAKRSTAAHGDPVEVRLQGDEVHRAHSLHRAAAEDGVERSGA